MVVRLWGARVHQVDADARDAKTSLQEWAQGRGMKPPSYDMVGRTGPDHAPVFHIVVRLDSGESADASDNSKRKAEQAAAKALLDRVSKG